MLDKLSCFPVLSQSYEKDFTKVLNKMMFISELSPDDLRQLIVAVFTT